MREAARGAVVLSRQGPGQAPARQGPGILLKKESAAPCRESSRSLPALCLLAALAILTNGCSLFSKSTLDNAQAVVGYRNDYTFLLDRYERRCGSSQPSSPAIPPVLVPADSSSRSACAAAFTSLNLFFDDLKKSGEGVDHKGPVVLWLKALKSDKEVCLVALKKAGANLP